MRYVVKVDMGFIMYVVIGHGYGMGFIVYVVVRHGF